MSHLFIHFSSLSPSICSLNNTDTLRTGGLASEVCARTQKRIGSVIERAGPRGLLLILNGPANSASRTFAETWSKFQSSHRQSGAHLPSKYPPNPTCKTPSCTIQKSENLLRPPPRPQHPIPLHPHHPSPHQHTVPR